MNWIVVDDPHGDDASYSEVVRDKDHNFLTRAIEPMLLDGGQLILVGTPLHADDIHGRCRKNPAWVCEDFPAIQVVDGVERELWPEFRPRHYLEWRWQSMGSLAFAQEYLLRPATSEASIFPRALFFDRPEILASWLRLRPSADEFNARDGWHYFAGVDFALSSNVGADSSVIVVLGVDEHMNRHLVELEHVTGMPYHQQLKLMEDVLAPYNSTGQLVSAYLEANQAQRIFGDELERLTDLPVVRFTTDAKGKNSLENGVPALRTLFENGKLRLARADIYSRQQTDLLMGELAAFAWVKDKLQGVGMHDDTVMALWFADQAVRRGSGFSYFTVGASDVVEPDEERPRYVATGRRAEDREDGADPDGPDAASEEASQVYAGAGGFQAMLEQGHVPRTCTLPPVNGGVVIWTEVQAGRSPCWGCRGDRAVCQGDSYRGDTQVTIPTGSEVLAVAPAPVFSPREWADLLEACGQDEGLAARFPPEREEWIDAWNSFLGAGPPPEWAAVAVTDGMEDQLYAALRALLVPSGG